MPSDGGTGLGQLGLSETDMVDNFLKALPHRMEQYSRDCLVMNPSTGRYEAPDENGNHLIPGDSSPDDDRTPIAATPADGQLAPPPTPASLAAALENGHGSLKSIPEDDGFDLAAPSRSASPDKASKVTSYDQDVDSNGGGSVDSAELNETKTRASAPSETRILTPTTATIEVFDTLSSKTGNQGLEASKYATSGVLPRISNSSRPRHSALATRDVNTNSVKSESTKPITTIIPETRKSSDTYQDRVVESFRKEHEGVKAETRAAKFEKPEGSPALTVAETSAPAAETGKPVARITIPADVPMDVTTAADGETRDEAACFASWGAPEARSGPKAEVRRVVLKGLPGGADNAFVAALIHGGAIESYRLVKAGDSAITTAVVIFATGAAAMAYYDKYPNGMDMKFQGKKYVAMVDMGENVDVVSGVLRGYLESGATRVVRAVGADEDWAMRALRKIAEGKDRKVEAIVDTVKDEGRTIEFRFTNIADAVGFRGSLMRDPDWADCSLLFGEDPCEKATGVRKV